MRKFLITIAAATCLSAQYVEILGTDYPANSRPQLNLKPSIRSGSGAPTGACTSTYDLYIRTSNNSLYGCASSTWAVIGGDAEWGGITGTLSAQTDLQSALDGKISTGGLAGSATVLATPRAINGVNFDGSAEITITANLPSNPTACTSGQFASDIAADGTLTCGTPSGSTSTFTADARTGTTEALTSADCGQAVTFSNASAVAVSLPASPLADGCTIAVKNIGAGDVTITPASGTISGAVSVVMSTGENSWITSNGTNYESQTVHLTVDSALSITRSRTSQQIGAGATLVTLSGTQTLTNKTISEADNIITLSQLITFVAANCQGTSAFTSFATPTANAPAAACATGTNTNFGTLDFDAATEESVQYHFPLASDWTGNIDLSFRWRAAATSGDVIWAVQTACVADGETGDPSFNTASTVTDTAKGTTLQFNDASISAITITGCAAGEEFFFRLYRDADAGGDTMTGDAQLIWARFTTRRAQ